MKVLIIGGYGTFGFRIAERLSNEEGLELILGGRSFEKSVAACAKLSGAGAGSGAATFTPLKINRSELSAETGINLGVKPDLIIDASGPFQTYSVFRLTNYCLREGIHYADLSDNGEETEFAKRFFTNEPTKDVILAFGLSTCPVLSAIGLREIESRIGPAADVMIGIAPSPKADLGRNVIAAVAEYAGQPRVKILRDGHIDTVKGLTIIKPETICAPGDLPLPRLPFAVADAADARILPDHFPALKNIWTGAGTRPIWLHRCLIYFARGAADGVFPKLSRFTNLFHRTRKYFRYGSHRGGMFVRASNAGHDASWHLIAEGDHGPYIPALPAVALVRKMLRGDLPEPGAYSGDELIGLAELAPEFASLDIKYGLQYDGAALPIYEKIMGEAYTRLPPAVSDLHRTANGRVFQGKCDVTRGTNPLSHIVAAIMGFPKSSQSVPVTLTVTPHKTGETWERNFNGKRFQSHHSLGQDKWARHITERFGPIRIHMAILEESGNLRIQTRAWSIFGIALPRCLKPGGDVYETQDAQGRFVFHVDLKAPIFGRLCKYHGWLEPRVGPD